MLRRRYVSVAVGLLGWSVAGPVGLSLVSAGLRPILVGVGVPIVVTIVKPDLHSGVPARSDSVIVPIDPKTKTAGCCLYPIVVAIDGQPAIGSRKYEVIVVPVDVGDDFAISDDKGVVIAVYIEAGLFILDIDSTVAARIVHFFTFI